MNNERINKFNKDVHFWGRLTIAIALVMSMSIPMYLTFVLGYVPSTENIIAGLVAIVGFVGIVWIVEPISYFPVLGPAGSYISFLSGNIGNMRLPVISAVQSALELEPGSKKAEVAGIFALVSSVIVNLAVLGVVMVAGQLIVSTIPASLLSSFNYALPGILGAMLVMYASSIKKEHTIMLIALGAAIAAAIKYSPNFLPAKIATLIIMGDVGVAAIFAIVFSLILAGRAGKSVKTDK